MNLRCFLPTVLAGVALLACQAAETPAGDVVYRCDFESADWWREWSQKEAPARAELVAADPERGFAPHSGKALRIRVERGKHDGISAQLKFKPLLGAEPEEMYFRYYLRLANDWDPVDGGKLPGFSGTYWRAGWGGRKVDGYNGWSARGLFRPLEGPKTATGFYCYHVDQKGRYGSDWRWEEEGRGHLENDRWYCVEHYVKLNTPGGHDGILRGWIDGQLAFEKTDIRFRDTTDLKVEAVWMCVYHGGGKPAPADMHLYIDDLVVSRNYMGPRAE